MINEITKDKNSFLKFIQFASQFYKADYYNFENVLYLYENCPSGKAFASFEDWNNNGRRIKNGEHGYRLYGKNNWSFIVFDISQTWGTRIDFSKFDKKKTSVISNYLMDNYELNNIDKQLEDRDVFYHTIYNISMVNLEKKNYGFFNKEKHFVSNLTALLVLNRCNYDVKDLINDNFLEDINQDELNYLLDTSYYFYRKMMFEVKDLEKEISLEIKTNSIEVLEEKKENIKDFSYQPSLFSLEETNEEQRELINVLKLGNNFSKGDEQIYRIITSSQDKKEKIKELQESFGIGGRSYVYLNGEYGWVNYDSRGIRIHPNDEYDIPLVYNWNEVYSCYKDLIDNREYPEKDLLEKLEILERNKNEILNNPYHLTDLDIAYQFLDILCDKYSLTELNDIKEKIKEDKQNVECYFETLEDLQDTISLLNYYLENNIIKREDINSIHFTTTEYNTEVSNSELDFSSFDEDPKKEIDNSKFIEKTYVLKAEDQFIAPSSDEDEEDLVMKSNNGDMGARNKLFEQNLRLVVPLVKKYDNTMYDLEDLVSIGTIGLIKAIQTYKLDKNIKLSTYASRCIDNEILIFLRKNKSRKVEINFEDSNNLDGDGNELHLEDVLSTDSNIVEKESSLEGNHNFDVTNLDSELQEYDKLAEPTLFLKPSIFYNELLSKNNLELFNFEEDSKGNIIKAVSLDGSSGFTAKEFYDYLFNKVNTDLLLTPEELKRIKDDFSEFKERRKAYIGKTLLLDNVVYKVINLLDNEDLVVIENSETLEKIVEDLDFITFLVDERQNNKDKFIDNLCRNYIDNNDEDIEEMNLNIERELQTYCLNNHFKYDDLKEEYDVTLLNMFQVKERLGTVYKISDVVSYKGENYIGNYKLTKEEYNKLFSQGEEEYFNNRYDYETDIDKIESIIENNIEINDNKNIDNKLNNKYLYMLGDHCFINDDEYIIQSLENDAFLYLPSYPSGSIHISINELENYLRENENNNHLKVIYNKNGVDFQTIANACDVIGYKSSVYCTIARATSDKYCAKLIYNDGKTEIYFGTKIGENDWIGDSEKIEWFNTNLTNDEILNLLEKEFRNKIQEISYTNDKDDNNSNNEQISLFENQETDNVIEEKNNNLKQKNEIKDFKENNNIELEKEKKENKTLRENFEIKEDYIYGGAKSKYKDNVTAIKLLKELEKENRDATKEEMEILAKYTGWGGIANAFDANKPEWSSEYNELKNLLTTEEYEKASESTLTSYYTPNNVIKSVWKIVDKLGFKTGNVLEPSMGTGNFFGNIPEKQKQSKLYGIELDSLSGRIARKLYPNANIEINGYQDTMYQDNFFDLAISNVPFGNIPIFDKRYKNTDFLIHNYYFQKTLDKVRPGGIIAFITSTSTLDNPNNKKVREYIAKRAELLGAFRLPNDTFKSIAGTKVTSDVIVLKKKDKLDLENNPTWLETGFNEDGIPVNNYYIENPDMILGKLTFDKSMYGAEDNTAVHPLEDKDINDLLEKIIENFKENTYEEVEIENETIRADAIPALISVKNNAYVVINDTIYQRNDSIMIPIENQESKTSERIKGMAKIRDRLKIVFDIQLNNESDEKLKIAQEKLNDDYDEFVKKYGYINDRANSRAFNSDPDYYLLSSIEEKYKENNKVFYKKGKVFTKRTIIKPKDNVVAENSVDGLMVSLNELGYIDIPYISKLINKSEKEVFDELDGLIYKEPVISKEKEKDFWVTSNEYLSGNIREKLKIAESENINGDLDKNVEALRLVLPKDLNFEEIDISLGAIWIPSRIIKNFCIDLLDIPYRYQDNLIVDYVPEVNSWILQRSKVRFDYGDVKNTKTWGTSRADALTLIRTALNLKEISIFDKTDDDRQVFNPKETAIAREKQNSIKEEFKEWVKRNERVKSELISIYNDKFNSIRLREYDGSSLVFKGISTEISLKDYQKDAVARILFGGNTLLDHCVGAGKTFEMATASMELKRLGISNKPLFVVPNHLTEQCASEFLKLYPNANILVATKKDFAKEKRKKLMARIATGEWDAVIVGHSSFGKIPVSKELELKFVKNEIREIKSAIDRLQDEYGKKISVKKMEALLKSQEKRIKELLDTKKDDAVTFEELGIDYLFVDEAHEFKNLALFSKMTNVSGISSTASQKASDLYMKIQYLDELNPNRSVVFATGTPISNSMSELYIMQKYLQHNMLKRMGLDYFDSWASIFGETITTIELSPDGGGFRNKTRFAKFKNVPELLNLYKLVADIKTSKMLNLPIPKLKFNRYEIISAPKSPELSRFIDELVERSEAIKEGNVPPYEDNMLKITNEGRKAALDLRLIDENMPDLVNSKINLAVDNIAKIYKETENNRSTQLVFCDLSTPKKDDSFSVYNDIKQKLIDKGIKENEITFIHDADTDEKKSTLFDDMNNGRVRILMGSTAKMGAGTNVQKKLIALHHLDCPWRPSDIEQREGRILRQGNENEEVQIFRYVTEGSFDGYSYQLVETKANFIEQIKSASVGTRTMEDVDDSALSYAEVKAIATGNPLIIEKYKVDNELKQLSLLKARYNSSKNEMTTDVTIKFPLELKENENKLNLIEQDLSKIKDTSGDNFSMEIMNVNYLERSKAGEALLKTKSILKTEKRVIGHFCDFEIIGYVDDLMKLQHYSLKGEYEYPLELSTSELGNIIKIENQIKSIPEKIETFKENIEKIKRKIEETKNEIDKPFAKEEELKSLIKRKNEIYKELGINENEENIVCEIDKENKQYEMEI